MTTRAVFLSYRREETRHIAGRLADRLTERLGSTQVFMDVDTIEPGADFAAAIAREVASCDVLIALIGPTWSTIVDRRGRRRLDDPDDIVVVEVRAALEREIRIIPVLVDGAVMPDRYDLPEGLEGLAQRNAVRLDHETFRSDVATLLDAVERILPTLAQKTAEQDDVAGAPVAYQRAIYSGHAAASDQPASEESRADTVPRSVDLSRDVQALRELARSAPGAAVVTAYGHVASALKELLAEGGDREPEQRDAPALARVAADRGLVTDQLVETVHGLAVLKDVGRHGGAGTGLSVEQANEYIDLVAAALYVLHSRRPV